MARNRKGVPSLLHLAGKATIESQDKHKEELDNFNIEFLNKLNLIRINNYGYIIMTQYTAVFKTRTWHPRNALFTAATRGDMSLLKACKEKCYFDIETLAKAYQMAYLHGHQNPAGLIIRRWAEEVKKEEESFNSSALNLVIDNLVVEWFYKECDIREHDGSWNQYGPPYIYETMP